MKAVSDINMEATHLGECTRRDSRSAIANVTSISVGEEFENTSVPGSQKSKCCQHGFTFWCKKYFWEGQELKESSRRDAEGQREAVAFIDKYRRLIGFAIPALIFHFLWWSLAITHDLWPLFRKHYAMAITMVFGSLVAGMTSEGGGAVAFPVMTLALRVEPTVARDFSMMIQSFGMSAASFAIFFMRVRIEERALCCCSLGGAAGIIFGLHLVDPVLTSSMKKLVFSSVWFAFASVLLFLNHAAKRPTFTAIRNFAVWKALVLTALGFCGGVFTSFSGSGIDICSFMILTLLFRISEKVATPTSVVLMAINSVVGFYWRGLVQNGIGRDAWEYLLVCVPVVVVGAPVGSLIGSQFHRLVLAALVIVLDTAALASAFAIIRPLTPMMIVTSVIIIVVSFAAFMGFTFAGQKMLDGNEAKGKSRSQTKTNRRSKERSRPCTDPENGHVNQSYLSGECSEYKESTKL